MVSDASSQVFLLGLQKLIMFSDLVKADVSLVDEVVFLFKFIRHFSESLVVVVLGCKHFPQFVDFLLQLFYTLFVEVHFGLSGYNLNDRLSSHDFNWSLNGRSCSEFGECLSKLIRTGFQALFQSNLHLGRLSRGRRLSE